MNGDDAQSSGPFCAVAEPSATTKERIRLDATTRRTLRIIG
jgi:hypothetical protein